MIKGAYPITNTSQSERGKLFDRFSDKLEIEYNFNRRLVSFQGNKDEPFYRWFKYKEGFSSEMVRYFLTKYPLKPGKILDPFAGIGTTLFVGQELGWEAYGIELLPVGNFVIRTREMLKKVDIEELNEVLKGIWLDISNIKEYKTHINHISITKSAFPDETEEYLNKYLSYCSKVKNECIKQVLQFAAFTVLEEISYTRKDGQYLRWDYRSKKNLPGKPFDKGRILVFKEAVDSKLKQITQDILPDQIPLLFEQFENKSIQKLPINMVKGSCLEELPKLQDNFFDYIITSPPYCNRYDYTRTYALELVYLGHNYEQIRDLRQSMLSCTVENKEKIEYLSLFYASINRHKVFEKVIQVYERSNAMTEVNTILKELSKLGKLNNNNITRMVKNYFLEICFVVYEMSRIMKSGGYCIIVNDNVRYGGEEIPVDLILCEFAESFNFNIKKIFVLPKGKGNSSQQMGNYGKTEVRKCIYLWQKK